MSSQGDDDVPSPERLGGDVLMDTVPLEDFIDAAPPPTHNVGILCIGCRDTFSKQRIAIRFTVLRDVQKVKNERGQLCIWKTAPREVLPQFLSKLPTMITHAYTGIGHADSRCVQL